jgi:hypothetical protein
MTWITSHSVSVVTGRRSSLGPEVVELCSDPYGEEGWVHEQHARHALPRDITLDTSDLPLISALPIPKKANWWHTLKFDVYCTECFPKKAIQRHILYDFD